MLVSVPLTVVVEALVSVGKFWKPSASLPPSFGVTPVGPRSMPRPSFWSIEFCVMIVFVDGSGTATPAPPLCSIVFWRTIVPWMSGPTWTPSP